jgi:hypothetical protein
VRERVGKRDYTMTTAATTLLIAKVRNAFVHVSREIAYYVECTTVYAVFWRTRCFPGITLGSDMEEWWGMASEEWCFQGQPIVDQLCDCSEHVQVMHRHHHGDPVVESLSIVVSQREKEREREKECIV